MNRLVSIDVLRGFIMMLMAIDHASAFIARIHFTEIWGLTFKGYPSEAWCLVVLQVIYVRRGFSF